MKNNCRLTQADFKGRITWPVMALAAFCPIGSLAQGSRSVHALEEIVVTAQKREQNLQDVPISIQAFSEDMLKNAGVHKVEDLALVTPGLTMTKQLVSNTPFIRGVGLCARSATHLGPGSHFRVSIAGRGPVTACQSANFISC